MDFCLDIFLEKDWPKSFMDSSITTAFNQQGDILLLVKINKKIIGCGGLKKLSEKEALLTRLNITKPLRGNGIGTKIFNTLLQNARKLKYKWIVLDVEHKNIEAIKFYKKQGMKSFIPVPHPRWKESAPEEKKFSRYFRKKI
jgi:N-acetylglutamate synthase-like GNAT family acetyltransferase